MFEFWHQERVTLSLPTGVTDGETILPLYIWLLLASTVEADVFVAPLVVLLVAALGLQSRLVGDQVCLGGRGFSQPIASLISVKKRLSLLYS